MSGLRGRSAVAADHRSALPRVPGIPWWAATIVAVALTAVGVAYDAGSGENALSSVFAGCYVLGCLAAVLAVRQSGVFTAVIQPPLILFVAVPSAYFIFHGSTMTGIKDTLINYGYPLIERFPLMFFTSATVLLIGMIRWYLGTVARRGAPKDAEPVLDLPAEAPETAAPTQARRGSRSATARAARAASAASAAKAVDAMADEAPRPPRRSAAGTGSRRSRHARPPETEIVEPVQSRPRRRTTPPVDAPAEPRRRPRATEPREPREPRERRPLPPLDRRPTADRSERPERPDRYDRPQRRPRPDAYDRPERADRPERPRRPRAADFDAYEPPPPARANGGSGTHHPVSRVRYRGADDGESRTEQRTRPRPSRHSAPESWEYDV